jgi:uncharacterized protein with HEPN domain
MLDSAQAVQKYVAGVTAEAFWDDAEKRDAVAMRIGVIGEAARHVTAATAAQLKEIPFPLIRGMRNRIAHDYQDIDYREVWNVAQMDIPKLVAALAAYFLANPPPTPIKTALEITREEKSSALENLTGPTPVPPGQG